jgi:rhodanese-related sulfurtransferase
MMPPPAPVPSEAVGAASRISWARECGRSAAIMALAAVLGLGTNFLSGKPVPLLAANGPGALPERAERVNIAALKELLNGPRVVLFVDVRRADPFKASHAVGSLNAPSDEFATYYQELDLSSKLQAAEDVVLICESDDCPSADRVAKFLKDLQHTNVRVLYGGWTVYAQAGLAAEGAR